MSPDILHDRGVEDAENTFEIDDPELLAELEASIADADRGELVSWEDAKRELRAVKGRRS